jgi:hypothetical protein
MPRPASDGRHDSATFVETRQLGRFACAIQAGGQSGRRRDVWHVPKPLWERRIAPMRAIASSSACAAC